MPISDNYTMKGILDQAEARKWASSAELEGGLGAEALLREGPSEDQSKLKSFGEILTDSLKDVNELQKEANLLVERLASGESKDLQGTMLAVEKADIAFRAMNQIRSKVLDAYREVMKMQL